MGKSKSTFPADLSFKYPWRSYQQKVLDQLDDLLRSRHFHLVAPPGSGKTVVGLEVVRRLDEPTLILAPTLTIKNQWIDRLVTLFMDTDTVPNWISDDLRKPGLLTVTTYQALHSLTEQSRKRAAGDEGDCTADEESPNGNRSKDQAGDRRVKGGLRQELRVETQAETEVVLQEERQEELQEDLQQEELQEEPQEEPLAESAEQSENSRLDGIIDLDAVLKQGRFKTLVLDEAHHLRAEWWRSTLNLRDRLVKPNLVALTATPPYDVAPAEWQKYIELCGPIDLEISVPELVREGDLCPHQDYVYLSSPSLAEKQQIEQFQENVEKVKDYLLTDEQFRCWVETHNWVSEPEAHLDAILGNPEYFSSMIVYLKEIGSSRWESLLPVLGATPKSMPKLNLEWLEKLLNGALFQDNTPIDREEHGQQLKKWLQRIGSLERRRVYLQSNRQLDRLLVHSISKLESINQIVSFEHKTMNDRLRLVVLTDYIRQHDLPKHPDDLRPLTRIGVIPIFEMLRRNQEDDRLKLAVLSGSIVILPKSALPALQRISEEETGGIPFSYSVLDHDERYVVLRMPGKTNSLTVRWVTDLFAAGEIQVLIGTTALLGEGWDAPCINSLVLASYVGSFMLSNQMRGRAIRTERGNPDKTSTIWHLVCIEPKMLAVEHQGSDLETLGRRFKTFVGLSNKEDSIESGFARLDLPAPPYARMSIDSMNRRMLELAGQREQLKSRWERAIHKEGRKRMVEEVRVEKEVLDRRFLWMNTIRAVLNQALMIGLLVFVQLISTLEGVFHAASLQVVLGVVGVFAIIGMLVALPGTIRAVLLLLRNGSVESNMRNVGEALLHTYSSMGLIDTTGKKVTVKTDQDPMGYVFCWLEDATTYEQTLFLDSLQELLGPIENPRYLLSRKSKLGPLRRQDYHAVPQWIGRNRDHATVFAEQWSKRVGKVELVYARNLEGRRILLNARMKSLSAAFVPKAERLSAWR
ncbi:DEAD/DEAH box helicase family protein [Paenibacillus senegalensis]|uniref:DEAD/DEAH box helicase family protein n=1 Tax=Paenibacillus senegalensis TaxID=1465766 RepID=UPI000287E8EB|nr:DEAD/DEAH box helicase family protein [Paenibacillus senegalensis]